MSPPLREATAPRMGRRGSRVRGRRGKRRRQEPGERAVSRGIPPGGSATGDPVHPSPCGGRDGQGAFTLTRPEPRRLERSWLGSNALALLPDAETAVEVFPALDAAVGVGAVPTRRQQLQPMLAEPDGIVAADG